MTCPVEDCPIKPDVDSILRLSGDLASAFRKLRKDLGRCRSCQAQDACQLRRSFNACLQAAITEVSEEWNLGM